MTPLQTPLKPSKLILPEAYQTFNVFAIPTGFSGCAWWRYRLPLKSLMGQTQRLNIVVADNPEKRLRQKDIEEHIGEADLVSLQAPGCKDANKLIAEYHRVGIKVAVDYDDFSFDLDPGNPRYADLGTRECEELYPDGRVRYRWRDGENGFDLRANSEKYEAFIACLTEADLVTTTTEYLASKFRKYNKNVAVCPNSIDFNLWKPIPRPEKYKGQIRIGWFGGDSHLPDIKIFKTLIPRVIKKYPQVKLVLQCPPVPFWKDVFTEIPENSLEWHNWADLKLYTLFLAARQWDIGLCPLDPTLEFNKCKSHIKVLEFAALGAATVSQNIPPYSVEVKHGKTGLLASTEDEWFEAISHLIENEALRKEIADNAYKDAFQRFNISNNCKLWEEAYIKTIEGKK